MRKTLLRLAVLAMMGGTTLSFVSCNKDFEEDLQQLRDDVTTQMNKQHQDLMDAIKQSEQSIKDYADAAAKAAKDYAENIAASEAEAAKAEAIAEANGYADEQIKEALNKAMKSVNEAIAKALKDAQAYADAAAQAAAEKAKLELLLNMEQKCSEVLSQANKYTDDQLAALKEDIEKVLTGKFNEIQGDIDALDKYVRDLKSELDKLNTDYIKFKVDIQKSIKSINGTLDNIDLRLNGIDFDIEDIRRQISGINTKLSTLETTLDNEIDRIDDLIDGINSTLVEHGNDIKALQEAVTNIRLEMKDLRSDLEKMIDTEINKLRGEMQNMVKETITNLESAIKAAKEDAIKNANNYTDEQKNLVEKSISQLQNQLNELKTAYDKFVEDTKDDIKENQDDIKKMFDQLSKVNLNISAIQTLLDGYGIKIENLENTIGQMREDFGDALKDMSDVLQGNIDALQQSMADQMAEIVVWLESLNGNIQTNTKLIFQMFNMIKDLQEQHYEDIFDMQEDIDTRFDDVYSYIDGVKEELSSQISNLKTSLEKQIADNFQSAKNYTDEQRALIEVITDNLQNQLDSTNVLLEDLRDESNDRFEQISASILAIEQTLTAVVKLAQSNQIEIGVLKDSLTLLTTRIDGLENQMKVDMEKLKNDIDNNMKTILADLEDLETRMGIRLDEEVKAIYDLLESYATIDYVNTSVQGLRDDVSKAFDKLTKYIDTKNEELRTELIQRLTQLGTDLGRAISEAEANAQKYTDGQIKKAVDTLILALDAIDIRIDNLLTQANKNTADIDSIFTTMAQHVLAIQTINSTLESYGIRLDSLDDAMEDMDAEIKKFGISINDLTSKVETLFSELDLALTDISALEKRIEALEQAAQSGADSLADVLTALDRVDVILSQRLTSMTFIPEFFDKTTNTPVIPFKSIKYFAANYNGFTDEVTRAAEPTIVAEDTTFLRFNVAPSNVSREGIEKIEFVDNEITLMAAGAPKEGFLKASDWAINANNELEVAVVRNPKVDAATGNKKTTVSMRAFIAKNLLMQNETEAFVASDYVTVAETSYAVSLIHNSLAPVNYQLRETLAEVMDSSYPLVGVSVWKNKNNQKIFRLFTEAIAAQFVNMSLPSDFTTTPSDMLQSRGFSVQFGVCAESASEIKMLKVTPDGTTTFQILKGAKKPFYVFAVLVDNVTGNWADVKFFGLDPIPTN